MSPEIAARLRMDAPVLLIGIIVFIIGATALLIYPLRHRKSGRLLLWFGAFSILYGVRILVDSAFTHEVFGVPTTFRRWTDALIMYVINVPSALLVRELFGEGWKRSLTWVVRIQAAFAICGIASDLIQRQPMTLSAVNSVFVVASMAVFVANNFRADLRAIPGLRVLAAGLAVFIITVVDENIARRSSRGLALEPVGFFCLLCGLGYTVARVLASTTKRLASMQHELETARRIQSSIMPQQMPRIPGLDIAVRYRPMTEVAGDFYDFVHMDGERVGVLVADVSGHGVPAALVASMVKIAIASQSAQAHDPARVLAGMNQVLTPHVSGQYVTAAYAFVDTKLGLLTYSGAAHPAIMISRVEGAVEEIERNGLMIGPFPSARYESATVQLAAGDLIVMYTDGITDAENAAGEDFGRERLRRALAANGWASASQIADSLLTSVAEWSPGPQQDDLTLVVIGVVSAGSVALTSERL